MYAGTQVNTKMSHSISPIAIIRSFIKYHQLIWQLSKREVIGRYRGSLLGLAWSFFNPLIMLAVYTIVFNTIFQARWNIGTESKTEFALVLFIGMIVHSVIAESLNVAPRLILGNVNYVKRVVFPLEILSWVMIGSILFHALISLCAWTLFYISVNHTIHWTMVLLPVLFIPLILFAMGLSWFVSSIGVYFRDIGQITAVLTTILLFVSPVFYPASRLSEPYRTLLYLNPLTYIIEQSRNVLMWGKLPDPSDIIILYVTSAICAWLGFIWFQKTRRGFADVL